MKKHLLIFLIFFSPLFWRGAGGEVFAQINLVPNPSFEDTMSCPHSANQVDRAVGWYPSRNSPDYFNGCDWASGTQAVPNNFNGFQHAKTGNAYCGFIIYSRNSLNYREDFTCQLLSPLVIGLKYNLSFFISKADKYYLFASNKIGMLLSTVNYNMTANAPINNYSQFYTDSIIIDTLNWVHITGSIIADSNYSNLTIGNFFGDSLTDSIYYLPGAAHSYYFIDDISITLDTTSSLSDVFSILNINIFPNPVREKLKITLEVKMLHKIEIINIKEQSVIQYNFEQGKKEEELDLTGLLSGAYILKLHYFNNTPSYHKLLKL